MTESTLHHAARQGLPSPLLLAALALACGCTAARLQITPEEYGELSRGTGAMPVVALDSRAGSPSRDVLRQKALPAAPADADLPLLIDRLRATLEHTGAVGIAAPQIGISRRVVLVRLGTRPEGQQTKVLVFVNPVVEAASREIDEDYEACLSVSGGGGLVPRATHVTVSWDPVGGGPRLSTTAWGWDARILQHEIDHLDGVLFVDRLKGPLLPLEEMRRLRDAKHRAKGWLRGAGPASAVAPASAAAPASAPAADGPSSPAR
jgi:peptide deformylase